MSARPEYLRLCRLIGGLLSRFSDFANDSFTEEIEKDLLIALSQVVREVKQLTDGFNSFEEVLPEPVDEYSVASTAYLDNRHCLAMITGNLIFFLTLNSQYAQHLVGNTLVAISEFLLTSDGDWDDYMQLLCLSLEFGIHISVRSSSELSSLESRCLDFGPSALRSLKLKLKSANWSVVAAILRVLHNIQKYLKQDFDEKIMKRYLDCVSSLMLNLPWVFLGEVNAACNKEKIQGSGKDILVETEDIHPKELTIFFGNFTQFLCSLVTQSSFIEDGCGFSPLTCRIICVVPKLTAWCHADLQSPYNVRTSHYFRHKILMLMVKFSSMTHIEKSISATWMHLIHEYFEDLLLLPIFNGQFDQVAALDGSPFSTSTFEPGKQDTPSRHLQRLTIFLFLKCSLNMASMKSLGESYENLDLKLDSECCNSPNLVELHEWLQTQVPDILVNHELYFDRCMRFTKSFLQLFMYEDDILFEILLQLFYVPFYPEHQILKNTPLSEVKNGQIFLVSDLFNPIHLFHLFLAEIHYDYQVLLDYLISKDTGSCCAEYLLRSLRIVCNSWSLFVEFPGVQDDLCQLHSNNQKADSTDWKGVLVSASLKDGRKRRRNYRLPFVAARDCLDSLATSVNNLHQKNLFPYNPKVLLQRLTRFQELCINQ